jgi:hypothetical protein
MAGNSGAERRTPAELFRSKGDSPGAHNALIEFALARIIGGLNLGIRHPVDKTGFGRPETRCAGRNRDALAGIEASLWLYDGAGIG